MALIDQSTFKQTLLNYTVGLYADKKRKVAEKLAPTVPVPTMAGSYQSYDSLDAFELDDTQRQPGAAPKVLTFTGYPNSYNCTPNSLDAVIPMELYDLADENTARVHYESIMRELVSRAVINHEYQIINLVNSSVSAETTTIDGLVPGANWSLAGNSTSSVDPLSQIESLYYQIGSDIGEFPNNIVAGPNAYRWLKHAYASRGTFPAVLAMTDKSVQDLYLNIGNGLTLTVATLAYGSNKGQSTRSTTRIVGSNDLFLFYSSELPGIMDRSAFKTLQFGQGFDAIRTYKSPDQRNNYIATDWRIQPVLTNKFAIKRITCT